MDIKALRQIFQSKWLITESVLHQWAAVAVGVISGKISMEEATEKISSVAKYDNRNSYNDFFRVDKNGVYNSNGEIQVISILNPVMKYDYCGSAGTLAMQNAIAAANADPTVKGIVLWIDSPGGAVDGTESFSNVIKESAKPVVAYVNSMMASAAYWIGSAADFIISDGSNDGFNSIIGSIGTMASWIDYAGTYEKEGAVIHEVYASQSTDKNSDSKTWNKGDYATLISEHLDPLNETFLNAVQNNRAGKIDLQKENVLTGKTYNAKDALKFGLIDKIGTFQQAVNKALILSRSAMQAANANTNNNSNSFNMKDFKNVLLITGVASVYEEESFFGLNEDQLEKVESTLQVKESIVASLESDKATLSAQVATLESGLIEANENFATANAEIETLQAEIVTLKAKDGAAGAEAAQEHDEKPAALPKTSVDLWWENSRK